MECALRPSISVWRFHAEWLSCRMKPNKQILSDVVYCICFKCEMKCVQCMYIVAKAMKIGLKIFTIIFVYCISVVLKTVQIQHKIVNAMKLCPSVIKSTTVNIIPQIQIVQSGSLVCAT